MAMWEVRYKIQGLKKSVCVCVFICLCVFEWHQMRGGWPFHRACEKLDLVELCQPGGQKSAVFVSLYSNQALSEIRKDVI